MGIFLYYALAIDKTVLPSLRDMKTEQSKATTNIDAKVIHFLNYICTHPLAIIEYHAIEMILNASSDNS